MSFYNFFQALQNSRDVACEHLHSLHFQVMKFQNFLHRLFKNFGYYNTISNTTVKHQDYVEWLTDAATRGVLYKKVFLEI